MIEKIKILLGFKQEWHVSYVVSINGRSGSHGDGIYTFRPKLTSLSIASLRKDLAAEASIAAKMEIDPKKINIIGLAKL